jgi:hypothetical protein
MSPVERPPSPEGLPKRSAHVAKTLVGPAHVSKCEVSSDGTDLTLNVVIVLTARSEVLNIYVYSQNRGWGSPAGEFQVDT